MGICCSSNFAKVDEDSPSMSPNSVDFEQQVHPEPQLANIGVANDNMASGIESYFLKEFSAEDDCSKVILPTEETCLKYSVDIVRNVQSKRCRDVLSYVIEAHPEKNLMCNLYRSIAKIASLRIDIPLLIQSIDSKTRTIVVSNSTLPIVFYAISHRWEKRDENTIPFKVILQERPDIWWNAKLSEKEASNICTMLPCWLDYVSLIQPSKVLLEKQMRSMSSVYLGGITCIVGTCLSPDVAPPVDYWNRLWCMQEYSFTRIHPTKAVRLAIDSWIRKESRLPVMSDLPVVTGFEDLLILSSALQNIWNDVENLVFQQTSGNHLSLYNTFIDFGLVPTDWERDPRMPVLSDGLMHDYERGPDLCPLSYVELTEFISASLRLRSRSDWRVNHYACLKHVWSSSTSYERDRVAGGLGCVVSLLGHKLPSAVEDENSLSDQYLRTLNLLELPPLRFFSSSTGDFESRPRAINCLMQSGQPFSSSAIPIQARAYQATVYPSKVDRSQSILIVFLVIHEGVIGLCTSNPCVKGDDAIVPVYAVDSTSERFKYFNDIHSPVGMFFPCPKEIYYPWEPSGAVTHAIDDLMKNEGARGEGEWRYYAECVFLGTCSML